MENEAVSLLQNAPPRPFITGAPNHRPFQKRFRDWNDVSDAKPSGIVTRDACCVLVVEKTEGFC